jgi:hypothetical protein
MYHAYPLDFEYLTGQAEPDLLISLKTNSAAGIDKPHIILQEVHPVKYVFDICLKASSTIPISLLPNLIRLPREFNGAGNLAGGHRIGW